MVNKVILVGFAGKDPEVRHLDSGLTVVNFNLATTEKWKNKDNETQETTEWHRIVLWRGLAEVAEKYIKKGSQLYLEGRLRYRKYTDKNNVDRYIVEVYGDTLKLLGRKESSDTKFKEQEEKINDSFPENEPDELSDLPF